MAKATLTISSRNYSSWSLRGWLLTRFSGLEFDEIITAPDDASARAEILLLSSSILVSAPRGRYRMGYAGDCGISQRDQAGRWPAAGRTAFHGRIAGRFAAKSTGISPRPRVAAG
jgi:hypothetical protein